LVHTHERTENGLKEGLASLISILLLQAAVTGFGLGRRQLQAALEQGHLGGEMAAEPDFDQGTGRRRQGRHEADVVAAAITAGTH